MDDLTKNGNSPLYNIKAAAKLTGLLPVTLRAWERRYGVPNPQRGNQGYRLYSENELRTLQWLKSQIDAGMNISHAIQYLNQLRRNGTDPVLTHNNGRIVSPVSTEILTKELIQTWTQYDENRSFDVLHRSHALYPMDQVLADVIQPALMDIGDSWQRGELSIATEHFASQICLRHLTNLMDDFPPAIHPDVIVAACAPGETHQIGLLMLVVILRWRGWDVKYLGPDLCLDNLPEALRPLHPRLLLISATRSENASRLTDLPKILEPMGVDRPKIVLGGQGFFQSSFKINLPVSIINLPLAKAISQIESILIKRENQIP